MWFRRSCGLAFSGGGIRASAQVNASTPAAIYITTWHLQALGTVHLLAHIDGQGFDDPYQGFIPSLGSIDYVSSVSGGGYTSVGWMSALCFGETDAPPQRTSLQHSVDVTFEHAMLHTPYPKCSFVANVFLVIGRSVLYHLALAAVVMYCGVTQVCAAAWLLLVTLFCAADFDHVPNRGHRRDR